jgi:hypothetical protein
MPFATLSRCEGHDHLFYPELLDQSPADRIWRRLLDDGLHEWLDQGKPGSGKPVRLLMHRLLTHILAGHGATCWVPVMV